MCEQGVFNCTQEHCEEVQLCPQSLIYSPRSCLLTCSSLDPPGHQHVSNISHSNCIEPLSGCVCPQGTVLLVGVNSILPFPNRIEKISFSYSALQKHKGKHPNRMILPSTCSILCLFTVHILHVWQKLFISVSPYFRNSVPFLSWLEVNWKCNFCVCVWLYLIKTRFIVGPSTDSPLWALDPSSAAP